MWIRTHSGRLMNIDRFRLIETIKMQDDHYYVCAGATMTNMGETISVHDTYQQAQAAIDRIHEWLDGLGAGLQHDPSGYPSHISTNFVLDLRQKEAPDETD